MTSFDIQKYLEGQPVITAGGIKIPKLKELNYHGVEQPYFTALVNGAPAIWNNIGVYQNGIDASMLLMMDEPIVYHWVLRKDIEDVKPLTNLNKYVKVIIPV